MYRDLDPDRDPYPSPHPAPIAFAEPWSYELQFPCDPRAPHIARSTLRAVLTAHELYELVERAELLTSELATNSVCHTKGPAAVRLHWRHPALRVSMWDPCPTLPTPVRAVRDDEPTGRGLLLLDLLADRWGGCALGEGPWAPGGKTVWFELFLGDRESPVLAA